LTPAVRDVLVEREQHITREGWTPEHDDHHIHGEMVDAAICYAQGYPALDVAGEYGRWPWEMSWWKPTNNRRNLVKATALLLAEIERIDRRKEHGL
jgi:hypothetical protein